MLSATQVAQHFSGLAAERGRELSRSDFDWLLYHAQGYALVINRQLLFSETIEASADGPVVPALHDLAAYPTAAESAEIGWATEKMLWAVYERHGPDAAEPRSLEGCDAVWRQAAGNGGAVDLEQMRTVFRSALIKPLSQRRRPTREEILHVFDTDPVVRAAIQAGLEDSRAGRVYRWE